MRCAHGSGAKFVELERMTKPRQNNGLPSPIPGRYQDLHGTRVGCVDCGQVRIVWEDGDVVTVIPGKDVKSY